MACSDWKRRIQVEDCSLRERLSERRRRRDNGIRPNVLKLGEADRTIWRRVCANQAEIPVSDDRADGPAEGRVERSAVCHFGNQEHRRLRDVDENHVHGR